MTPQERQAKLDACVGKFVIMGFLKEDGRFDCCIAISDLDFKKELERFEIYRTYRLTEIHKR